MPSGFIAKDREDGKRIISPWRGQLARVLFRPAMPKFYIKTYGCQMNERDTEQVAHRSGPGYALVANEAEADVVLLNTCSVRDMADQKALGKMGMLGRMAKERPQSCSVSLVHGPGRGESLVLRFCRMSISWSARKSFIASRITWRSWSRRNIGGHRGQHPPLQRHR